MMYLGQRVIRRAVCADDGRRWYIATSGMSKVLMMCVGPVSADIDVGQAHAGRRFAQTQPAGEDSGARAEPCCQPVRPFLFLAAAEDQEMHLWRARDQGVAQLSAKCSRSASRDRPWSGEAGHLQADQRPAPAPDRGACVPRLPHR